MKGHFATAALTSFFLGASLVSGTRQDPVNKPAINENVDWSGGLLRDLHGPSWTVTEWAKGTITAKCKEVAVREKMDPTKMTVYEVLYADCPVSWRLCRHADSQVSITRMIDRFGRLPVRMRQFSQSQIFLPNAGGGPWGYTINADIVYFGPAENPWIYLHETMHAMEWSDVFNSSRWMTEKPRWLAAVDADTHVISGYARTNGAENLAENAGPRIFDKVVAGGIKGADPQWPKYQNQQATLDWEGTNGKYGGNLFKVGGQSCSSRYPNDQAVSASSSSKFKRWLDPRALLPLETIEQQRQKFKSIGVNLIEIAYDSKILPEKTKCQFAN